MLPSARCWPRTRAPTRSTGRTWVVGEAPSVVVIDPGPDDPAHLDEVALAAGGDVSRGARHPRSPRPRAGSRIVRRPRRRALYAFRLAGAEHLRDGQLQAGGDAHRGAHARAYQRPHGVPPSSEGALFTGDALGRGTSFIDPPDGDLPQYLRSLARMQELAPRDHPGHGPVVLEARGSCNGDASITAERDRSGRSHGPRTVTDLVGEIYAAHPSRCTSSPPARCSRTCWLDRGRAAQGRSDVGGRRSLPARASGAASR